MTSSWASREQHWADNFQPICNQIWAIPRISGIKNVEFMFSENVWYMHRYIKSTWWSLANTLDGCTSDIGQEFCHGMFYQMLTLPRDAGIFIMGCRSWSIEVVHRSHWWVSSTSNIGNYFHINDFYPKSYWWISSFCATFVKRKPSFECRIFPYNPGLLHWHRCHHIVASVPGNDIGK